MKHFLCLSKQTTKIFIYIFDWCRSSKDSLVVFLWTDVKSFVRKWLEYRCVICCSTRVHPYDVDCELQQRHHNQPDKSPLFVIYMCVVHAPPNTHSLSIYTTNNNNNNVQRTSKKP